jgi:hypothetical protein
MSQLKSQVPHQMVHETKTWTLLVCGTCKNYATCTPMDDHSIIRWSYILLGQDYLSNASMVEMLLKMIYWDILATCKTINYESPQCQINALLNLQCKLETNKFPNKAICDVWIVKFFW